MSDFRESTWQDVYDDTYDDVTCPKCKKLTVYKKNNTGRTIMIKCSGCGEELEIESDPVS